MKRPQHRITRFLDRIFDGLGLRPVGIVGFAGSAAALAVLVGFSTSSFRSDAVAVASWIDHPAMVSSFATEVLVEPGDRVETGTELVRLSSHFIDQRIARVESQIAEVRNEAELAQAEIAIAEQHWLSAGARVRPGRPSLRSPTEAVYARQVEVLETRKLALMENRESLLVRSRVSGLVASVVRLGGAVEEGGSVASITRVYADEIVAYVPAATPPEAIAPGAPAQILEAHDESCRGPARVLRRGAAVGAAPPQLQGLLPFARHGLPVHISLPSACRLGVGQVIAVDFQAAGIPR